MKQNLSERLRIVLFYKWPCEFFLLHHFPLVLTIVSLVTRSMSVAPSFRFPLVAIAILTVVSHSLSQYSLIGLLSVLCA